MCTCTHIAHTGDAVQPVPFSLPVLVYNRAVLITYYFILVFERLKYSMKRGYSNMASLGVLENECERLNSSNRLRKDHEKSLQSERFDLLSE